MILDDLLNDLEHPYLVPPTDPEVRQDWLIEQQERVVATAGAAMERLTRKFLNEFIDSIAAAGDYTIIDTFLNGWRGVASTALGDAMVGMWTSGAVEAWIQAPGEPGPGLPQQWATLVNENAVAYRDATIPRIVNAGEDTLRDVQNITLNKLRTGQDPRQLRADIQEVTGYSRSRAATIARTEVIGAYNNGNMAGARELGDLGPVKKEWSAVDQPGRTRETHLEADGQTVWFDEPFIVGGEEMDAPHDPGASPEETINCRCQVILLYEGDIDRDGNVVLPRESSEPQDIEPEVVAEEMVTVDTMNGPIQVPSKYVYYENDEQLVDYGAWNRANKEAREQALNDLLTVQSAVSAEVQQSANVYQSAFGMFTEINGALRTGSASQLLNQHLANLDALFVDRLPRRVTLHRGRQFENARELTAHMKGLQPGAVISDAGFVSTSLDATISGQFSGFGRRPAVNYEIRAAKGSTRYRVLAGSESEILLPRGTNFRVVSVEKGVSLSKFDNWNVVLEVVE